MNYSRLAVISMAALLTACGGSNSNNSSFQAGEDKPGGDTTTGRLNSAEAFSESSANLLNFGAEKLQQFEAGDVVFTRSWVEAPTTVFDGRQHRDGVGPLFNTGSCQDCHIKDARGHVPNSDGTFEHAQSMLIRVSIPYGDPRATAAQRNAFDNGEAPVIPHPVYGGQYQDRSSSDFHNGTGEGDIKITWQTSEFSYPDGEKVTLRKPIFELVNLQFGELADEANGEGFEISPRISPQMIGLGLLEAITADDILANVDETDSNNDGISGKANYNNGALGRFGWKAGNPTLRKQGLGAFAGDIGVTSADATSTDCTAEQGECQSLENKGSETGSNNGGFELRPQDADTLIFYTQHLAVPSRPNASQGEILAGKKLFNQVGCQNCHQPSYTTGVHPDSAALSNQLIWPYTDLLLHDMGEELADNRPEFKANGQEWRTAPLWGIGLTAQIVGADKAQFLHDGRARSIEEAILWHGGEAATVKQKFSELNKEQRTLLLNFVKDL